MTAKQKKHRTLRKNTITTRWLVSNLGVVFLVLLIVELAVFYILQHYYYNSAEQYLTTKISSVSTVLTRYAQDSSSNFSSPGLIGIARGQSGPKSKPNGDGDGRDG